jgi:enoyl-CoA hydratase/carnithine racemase
MLGERIDSAQMLEWGIAHWRVPDDSVVDEAVAVAERLAGLSERAVTDLRRIMTTVSVAELEAAMLEETRATVAAFGDPDATRRVREAAP